MARLALLATLCLGSLFALTAPSSAAAAASGSGVQRLSLLAIPVSWPGAGATVSAAEIQSSLDTTGQLLAAHSYGKITIARSVVSPLVMIAPPGGSCPYEAESEAALAHITDAKAYDRLLFVLPGQPDCDWAGTGELSGNQIWLLSIEPDTIEHELGHTFGLWHPYSSECWPLRPGDASCAVMEYGDRYSIMGASTDAGFSAPELATIGLLSPPPLTSGKTYQLRPLSLAPDALAVPSAQGVFWFENRQQVGYDHQPDFYTCRRTAGIVVHLASHDETLWQFSLFGLDAATQPFCGFTQANPWPSGGTFTVPGSFQVSYQGGDDPAGLRFSWLDQTPPARPKVAKIASRLIMVYGSTDAGSGLAGYELRLGKLVRRVPAYGGKLYLRRGLVGAWSLRALDHAGNRSAAVAVRLPSRTGAVRLGR